MTVASNLNKHTYRGNGAQKAWPYTFKTFSTDGQGIKVYLTNSTTGAVTEVTSNFTVDASNNQVIYPTSGAPLQNEFTITLLRIEDITQELDLINQGEFLAQVVEDAFDRQTAVAQQLQEQLSRTLKHSIAVADDVSTELPAPVAGKSFRWSNDGKKLELTEDPAAVLPAALAAKNEAVAAAALAESSAEVLSQYQADTFFEVDTNGDYMPALEPGVSNKFQLDENLDIMPI